VGDLPVDSELLHCDARSPSAMIECGSLSEYPSRHEGTLRPLDPPRTSPTCHRLVAIRVRRGPTRIRLPTLILTSSRSMPCLRRNLASCLNRPVLSAFRRFPCTPHRCNGCRLAALARDGNRREIIPSRRSSTAMDRLSETVNDSPRSALTTQRCEGFSW
jgi:hypothetical protein